MASNNNPATQNDANTLKVCTINICGMSNRSKFSLNKFLDTQKIDILCAQETDSTDSEKLELSNMCHITDTNRAANRGAALYARNTYSIIA